MMASCIAFLPFCFSFLVILALIYSTSASISKRGRKAMQEAIEAQAEFDPEKTELKSTKKEIKFENKLPQCF